MIKRSWGCPIVWSWMLLSDLASPTDEERSTPQDGAICGLMSDDMR
jgi:hypothetical protein